LAFAKSGQVNRKHPKVFSQVLGKRLKITAGHANAVHEYRQGLACRFPGTAKYLVASKGSVGFGCFLHWYGYFEFIRL
jgi:hypothetical protein